MALRTDPPFGRYIFVDRNPTHAESLGALRKEFPKLANRISVRAADANTFLQQWCRETDWNRNRAVVFLDPYGMQVDWSTIEAIAATEALSTCGYSSRSGRPSTAFLRRATFRRAGRRTA